MHDQETVVKKGSHYMGLIINGIQLVNHSDVSKIYQAQCANTSGFCPTLIAW